MAKAVDPQLIAVTQASRAQAESEALFLSIGEGAIVTDSEAKVSRINQAALDMLGYEVDDIVGKWFPGVVVAEDEQGNRIANINRPITEVFLTGKAVFHKIYYRRKDGSRFAVALTASPVMIDDKPVGAIEVFRDITEEIRLERAKDEFISLASHQLRTPATAVKQYAGMLLQGYAGELTDAQLSMARSIYDSNERQINTINDLLRVAQLDAGQVQLRKRRLALIPLLENIIDDLGGKFEDRSQSVAFDHPPREVWIVADEERLRMVLENIIDNASKYTPPGKKIWVNVVRSQPGAEIHIRDQGVGIAPKDVELIFDKFTRIDNPLSMAVGGTGLGLYWAKKIIDLHGAELRVQSRPNKGSTFSILLP